MGRIDGGEILVRVFEQHGIDVVFTLHGGHLDAIYQAARGRPLRWIDTRHEQAAGHAADGWARTTGRVGVAMVTAGPGVTDVVTAVTNAYLDCIPTLFIGGAAPLRDAETLPLQGGFDQVAMMRPVTKWAHRITHTHRIGDLAAQALRVATTGRPGPVFLELPIDVLFGTADEQQVTFPERIRPGAVPAPSPHAVEDALARLARAERPAIVAGGGAWFSGAGPALPAFAERTGIPVFSTGKAHGVVPADHPLCGRSAFTLAALAAGGMGPDVVLVLGARLGLFTGGRGGGFLRGCDLIQIDIAGEEIGRNRDVDLGIVAELDPLRPGGGGLRLSRRARRASRGSAARPRSGARRGQAGLRERPHRPRRDLARDHRHGGRRPGGLARGSRRGNSDPVLRQPGGHEALTASVRQHPNDPAAGLPVAPPNVLAETAGLSLREIDAAAAEPAPASGTHRHPRPDRSRRAQRLRREPVAWLPGGCRRGDGRGALQPAIGQGARWRARRHHPHPRSVRSASRRPRVDPGRRSPPHSAPTCAPFSATERRIRRTRNTRSAATTAADQKTSKYASAAACRSRSA
jgi:hypothetical protein